MIMFDYQKLWIISGGNSVVMLRHFNILVNKEKGFEFLVGDNYIINESILTKNPLKKKANILAEYLGLCALRPYSVFKHHGFKDLSLELCPNYIPKSIVEECPWVELRGDKLIFTGEQQSK